MTEFNAIYECFKKFLENWIKINFCEKKFWNPCILSAYYHFHELSEDSAPYLQRSELGEGSTLPTAARFRLRRIPSYSWFLETFIFAGMLLSSSTLKIGFSQYSIFWAVKNILFQLNMHNTKIPMSDILISIKTKFQLRV